MERTYVGCPVCKERYDADRGTATCGNRTCAAALAADTRRRNDEAEAVARRAQLYGSQNAWVKWEKAQREKLGV